LSAPKIPEWLQNVYPFTRKVVQINGLKIHYVDEGPEDAQYTVLMLHGNPTWSFLWRKVIAQLIMKKRIRIIAPDLVGFGLSSKFYDTNLIGSLDFQISMMVKFVDALKLKRITIVGQDWGGPIIAGMAARSPHIEISAAVFANTSLILPKKFHPSWFHRFSHVPIISDLVFRIFGFPLNILHRVQGDPTSIGTQEKRAYQYPFLNWHDRISVLLFARMVPTKESHPTMAVLKEINDWASNYKGDVALVWGTKDPILGGVLKRMKEMFSRALVIETDAGHFLQEEIPEKLSSAIAKVTYKD